MKFLQLSSLFKVMSTNYNIVTKSSLLQFSGVDKNAVWWMQLGIFASKARLKLA
jgi:hypothetical protein